jgi:hypothetical protein
VLDLGRECFIGVNIYNQSKLLCNIALSVCMPPKLGQQAKQFFNYLTLDCKVFNKIAP